MYLRAVRKIKPNPADPDWKFPFASRERIAELEHYFSTFHERKKQWGFQKPKEVLDPNRKNKLPWESVPPHRREYAQQLFDGYMEKLRKQGRPITQGLINSRRALATLFARTTPRKIFYGYLNYKNRKTLWLAYQDFVNQQQRAEFVKMQGPNEHKVIPL
jgi:hypothetical protein